MYLSGPMTGLPGLNETAFRTAAAELTERGYYVIVPHDGEPDPAERGITDLRSAYMAQDFLQILTEAHLMYVLPGWAESEGARDEVRIAQVIGMPVIRFANHEELENPAVVTLPRNVNHKYEGGHPYGD